MDNLSLFFLIFGLGNKNSLVDYLMILGAEYVIYITIILLFIFSIYGEAKERKSLILFALSLPIIILIIKLIHLFYFAQRPFVEQDIIPLIQHKVDASFPSRHVSIMTALAFSYIFFKSPWYFLLLLLTVWVAIARVYVGVHYPIDILGGVIVGVIAVLMAKQFINLLKLKLF